MRDSAILGVKKQKMMALEPPSMTATVQELEQFIPHHSLQRNGLIILGEEGQGFDKAGGKVCYPKSTAVYLSAYLWPLMKMAPNSQRARWARDAPPYPLLVKGLPFKLLITLLSAPSRANFLLFQSFAPVSEAIISRIQRRAGFWIQSRVGHLLASDLCPRDWPVHLYKSETMHVYTQTDYSGKDFWLF